MIIDLVEDFACPFCYIGKRHLAIALSLWDGPPPGIRHRAFMLDPSIPPEGLPFLDYMERKGAGRINPAQFFDAPRKMGAQVGLEFNFEKISHAVNTELAHRFIRLSPAEHRDAVIDSIYRAYFGEGRNIGQIDVLLSIAGGLELNIDAMAEQLNSRSALDEVRNDQEWARLNDISAVPHFVIDQRLALSGAHPPETLLAAITQASETSQGAIAGR